MVRVYSSQILAMVENMKNILEMHQIEAHITNQYLIGAVGEIPPNEAWPQLWVDDGDYERAKQVVDHALSSSADEQELQTCPNCGEQSEGQFAVCWNCGAPLDE